MKCAQCSAAVPDTASFCHNCGSQVSDAEGQAAVTTAMDGSAFAHLEGLLREDTEGEFKIERLLGRGGMAVVFLATEVHLARKVAIKVLPPELTFGHGVERFKREAKTAAALDHPHIIPIYRIASGGKLFWYAMKFLEGRALDELLKEEQRFSVEKTIEILEPVADALDYAHEHQVIHRDMKPANVMLDNRNRVVVTDFGIAKALTEGTLTASGSVVGTPYYMSPEQGMGKPVTGAADQYSLAVMAYRMLSGQVPFEGESAIDILHKHCMVAPPPLAGVQPGLPPHVYWAVHKGLGKKADGRFSSVTEFVEALKHPTPEAETSQAATIALPMGLSGTEAATVLSAPGIATGSESAATPVTLVPVDSQPRRRRRTVVGAALGIIAVTGIAGGSWWFMGQRTGSDVSTTQRPESTVTAAIPPAAAIISALDSVPRQPEPTEQLAAGPGTERAQPTTTTTQQPTAQPTERETTPVQRTTPPPRRATPPPRRTATPVPSTGRLTIVSLPSSGRVWIDGRRQSGTVFELSNGRHEVRLAAAGYEQMIDTVTIRGGEQVRLPFTARPRAAAQPPRMSYLEILVRPWAIVSIDGQDRGRTTQLRDSIPVGRHTIRFTRSGFATKDTTVTLEAGRMTQLRIRMQRNQ